MKRTIGELEYYKELLLSLLQSIRTSTPDRVNRLLELVRSNASLSQLASAIADAGDDAHDSQTPPSSRTSFGSDTAEPRNMPWTADDLEAQTRRTFVTLEKLCDIPLFKVPAAPWTTVTDDDHLVSHLVSLYFTWDHPFSQLIDQTLFLGHMEAGDLKSEFCTPFLVNSILAVASVRGDTSRRHVHIERINVDRRRHIPTSLKSSQSHRTWTLEASTSSKKLSGCGRSRKARRHCQISKVSSSWVACRFSASSRPPDCRH